MNKERLTLLIALSILIVITIIVFLTGAGLKQSEEVKIEAQPQVEAQGPVAATKPDLITTGTPKAKEEPKVEEEVVIIPPAAAGSIAQQVWDAMKAKGWSDEVCAGIMANIIKESGDYEETNDKIVSIYINPNALGDNGRSYGLCQWHESRMRALISFCKTETPNIQQQINYLEYELKGYNIINSNKSCGDIAYDFCYKFERPANKTDKANERKELAYKVYDYFVNK